MRIFCHKIEYLKWIISMNKIMIYFTKRKTIEKRITSINFKHVKLFISFYYFYRRFIKSFFKIVKFLNVFFKKNIVFVENKACDALFRKFKNKMLKTSIFWNFDRKKQCYLKIDFSNIVNDELLSQKLNYNLIHFIAFFFEKHEFNRMRLRNL